MGKKIERSSAFGETYTQVAVDGEEVAPLEHLAVSIWIKRTSRQKHHTLNRQIEG